MFFSPTIDISEYVDEKGEFTAEGALRLKEKTDREYEVFNSHRLEDEMLHSKLKDKIDLILVDSDSRYDEIFAVLESYDYKKLSNLFFDFTVFRTTYAICKTEIASDLEHCLYDLIKSIDDYNDLFLTTRYLFRRIKLRCEKDDIRNLFDEVINKGVSFYYIIQTLKDIGAGDYGYIGNEIADLYMSRGMVTESTIIRGFVDKTYDDKESTLEVIGEGKHEAYGSGKICFITCVNNERMYQECLYYINRLVVPKGYEIETIAVTEADCMTSGYNAAMDASDAKIKVYLHQDVCIINPFFIEEILRVFNEHSEIGMIGLVGSPKLPPDCVMWHGKRVGNLFSPGDKLTFIAPHSKEVSSISYVEAVDGFMMITNKDLRWREDVFDGWDFYDISQCQEFRTQGYRIAVPEQASPWVIHDDGILSLYNYDKYRKKLLSSMKEK